MGKKYALWPISRQLVKLVFLFGRSIWLMLRLFLNWRCKLTLFHLSSVLVSTNTSLYTSQKDWLISLKRWLRDASEPDQTRPCVNHYRGLSLPMGSTVSLPTVCLWVSTVFNPFLCNWLVSKQKYTNRNYQVCAKYLFYFMQYIIIPIKKCYNFTVIPFI